MNENLNKTFDSAVIRSKFLENKMDNRRPNRVHRYDWVQILFLFSLIDSFDFLCRFRPGLLTQVDDALPEYMNLLGMICSMCSLMLKVRNFRKTNSINTSF